MHPVIDSINAATGTIEGGQNLKINGFGLSGNAVVHVDGKPCEVRSNTDTEIICRTTSSPLSTEGYQPGQPGVIQTLVDPANPNESVWWAERTNGDHPRIESHLSTFETHVN